MRDNYSEHGVEEVRKHDFSLLRIFEIVQYYKKVGRTYRNPHFPGIRTVLWLWFNRYGIHIVLCCRSTQCHASLTRLLANEGERIGRSEFNVFDMACG